jgi:asparagine synthase (glutamine-hydrolysing)
MVRALSHRGPDEDGIYQDDWAALGHARLSIIDLEGGTQPIHNEDKTLWIVFNGEIFNYPELRKELEKKGHRFYTNSDTETIVHAYEEEGEACLHRFNGQFAFAIWNSKERQLFLARDRLGIRPLHYTVCDGTLAFASEIKSLFQWERVQREIDPVSVGEVFTYWTTLPGRTVFKGVYELPPGHYMKVSEGRMVTKRYWDVPFLPPEEQIDWPADKICERIRELLQDAIRIRLRADVPVGCYLSGGLDSSGVTSLVVRDFNSQAKTFGIRFEEGPFDEGEHQNLMVSRLGVDHEEIRATNNLIGANFARAVWHCEKPTLRTAPVPLLLLSERVRERGFKVVLTGEGADEVFGGYNIFREAKVRRFWSRRPESEMRAALIGRLYPYIFNVNDSKAGKFLKQFFARGLDRRDDPVFSHFIRWENTRKLKNFFSQDLQNDFGKDQDYHEIVERLPESFSRWDYLAKAQYLEMMTFLSGYLLSSQGDRVAMANSVEIRLPYLDYRIVEFMGQVPSLWKIHCLDEKHILKRAFCGLLPEEIRNRPKHPYRAPIKKSLLNGVAQDSVAETLSEKSVRDAGLFDPAKVDLLLKKLDRQEEPGELDNMALAGILSTQIVHDRFVKDWRRVEI